MRYFERITALKNNVKVLNLKNSDRIVIFSDCHRGDGTFKDSLYPNSNIYLRALRYYYNEGFTYIEAGDGDELWKFKYIDDIFEAHQDEYKVIGDFKDANKFYMIYGNHDKIKTKKCFKKMVSKLRFPFIKNFYSDLDVYESILLSFPDEQKDFLVFHGHQVDFLNYEFAFVSKFLVRYVWGFLNGVLSFKEITSPAKSLEIRGKVEKKVSLWCKENNYSVIIGHTHNPSFANKKEDIQYFNCGACVLPNAITCIEIKEGTIALIRWTIRAIDNGILAVKKELISKPRNI